jgi:hypothetical protein
MLTRSPDGARRNPGMLAQALKTRIRFAPSRLRRYWEVPMQALLLGTWGPRIVATAQQHPWRFFAAVLVLVRLLDMLLRRTRGTSGDADIGGWDFGGDGDACGD